jgi:hypothetical protein
MNKDYIEILKNAMGEIDSLAPAELQAFIDLTVNHLYAVNLKIASADPKEREAGLKAAEELKGIVSEQMEQVRRVTGKSAEELTESEKDLLDGAVEKEMLAKAKEHLLGGSKKRTKKFKNKINLVG